MDTFTGHTVLVTGGAGFIGTRLTERIHQQNHVLLLDNLHRNAIGRTGLLGHPNVELIQGDVMDPAVVRKAVERADIVVHMASIAGVDTVLRNPVLTMKVSLLGTYNVLEAAREVGRAKRVVDFSTSEVFGQYAYRVTEGQATALGAVGEARWTYAVSKLATEHLAFNYCKQYGLPTVSIRPFNVFGPRQVGEGAIHHFVVKALTGQDLMVHNDGSQIRSWCYIDDMVDGLMLCLTRDEAVGHAFNIGNPRSTITIFQLAQLIVRLAKSPSKVRFVDWPGTDVELRIPSIEKARERLGFEPRVDLEDGILRTLDWYKEKLRSEGVSVVSEGGQ